jgi:hypothetical protein
MKTLQTQYNLIKEGKGSKHIFLKEAKLLYPDMLTNFSTFEQTEKILKNRGVINENFVGLQPINDWGPSPKQDYEIAFKNFLSEMEEEKVKADTKKVSKYVEDTDAHSFNNKDKKNIDNLSGQEVLNGFYIELKAPKNADKTKDQLMDIVTKNLSKDPLYYIKNGQFGTEGVGYTEDAPGLGKPKEAKGKYKSSGYGDLDNKQTSPKSNVKDSGKSENKTGMPKKVKEMDMKPQSSKGVQKMATPGKPKTVKLNEIGMFHDPIGYDKRAKSRMEVARDILMDAGLSDKEIEKFISDNMFKKGRLDDLAKEYIKSLKGLNEIENMGMDLETAKAQAQANSEEGYVQHVNKNEDGTYSISDWYDSDSTVYSYENGMSLNENQESNTDVLKDLISRHDWYFEMSDDRRKYRDGQESEDKIMSLVNKMGDEGKKIYNSMAPKDRQLKESVVDRIVESILGRLKKFK